MLPHVLEHAKMVVKVLVLVNAQQLVKTLARMA